MFTTHHNDSFRFLNVVRIAGNHTTFSFRHDGF